MVKGKDKIGMGCETRRVSFCYRVVSLFFVSWISERTNENMPNLHWIFHGFNFPDCLAAVSTVKVWCLFFFFPHNCLSFFIHSCSPQSPPPTFFYCICFLCRNLSLVSRASFPVLYLCSVSNENNYMWVFIIKVHVRLFTYVRFGDMFVVVRWIFKNRDS